MSKKADMSIQTVVVAALAMIVLIILIVIFKTQIGNLSGGFTSTGNSAKAGLKGTQCQTMLNDRICETNSRFTTDYKGKYDLTPVPSPVNGSWTDCTSTCYEIGSKIS